MPYQLDFPIQYHFESNKTGILIPCLLTRNGCRVTLEAKVDPGSEYCLFRREIAESLQIEVEDGVPVPLSTLAGSLIGLAHTVVLNTFDLQFESTVLFNPARNAGRNILGRVGWLNNLHLGLTMDDEMIYLAPAYQ